MENNSVHLCRSCCKSYPECFDNDHVDDHVDDHVIEFGDGIGNDNICCCSKYEPLMERDYDRGLNTEMAETVNHKGWRKEKKDILIAPIIGYYSWLCRYCFSRIIEGQKVCDCCGYGIRWR